MSNFIYAFSTECRDKLLSMQYELLKSDDVKCIYVFLNNGRQDFSCYGIQCALSDTLTF